MPYNKLQLLREAGNVKRWHTFPLIGEQLVSSHSWNMVTLLFYFEKHPSMELVKACHFHDIAERFIGDLPATIKWNCVELKELLHKLEQRFEKAVFDKVIVEYELIGDEPVTLKFLDTLELIWFCKEQLMLGNKNAETIMHNGVTIIDKLDVADDWKVFVTSLILSPLPNTWELESEVLKINGRK